jgi:hypothetical protein
MNSQNMNSDYWTTVNKIVVKRQDALESRLNEIEKKINMLVNRMDYAQDVSIRSLEDFVRLKEERNTIDHTVCSKRNG